MELHRPGQPLPKCLDADLHLRSSMHWVPCDHGGTVMRVMPANNCSDRTWRLQQQIWYAVVGNKFAKHTSCSVPLTSPLSQTLLAGSSAGTAMGAYVQYQRKNDTSSSSIEDPSIMPKVRKQRVPCRGKVRHTQCIDHPRRFPLLARRYL
jgi:hypothetical protein